MGVNNVRGGIGTNNRNVTAEINLNHCVSQSSLNDIMIISVQNSNIQPDSRSAASSSYPRGFKSGVHSFFSNMCSCFRCYKRSSSSTHGSAYDPALSGRANLAFDSQDGFISDRTQPPPNPSSCHQGTRASSRSSSSPMPREAGGSVRSGTTNASDFIDTSAASKRPSSVKKNPDITPVTPQPPLTKIQR